MTNKVSSLALLAALSWATPAHGQDAAVAGEARSSGPGALSVDLGLFVGGFFASDDHEFYDPLTSMQSDLGAAEFDFGVRAAFYPLRYVGVEAEGVILPSVTPDGGNILGFRGHVIGQLPMMVTPFAVFGVGTMAIFSDDDALGDDGDGVIYGGVGARFRAAASLDLRADLRVIGAPKANSFGGATAHVEVLIGASWDFGAVEAPARVAVVEPPPEPLDDDRDGFVGAADKCPDERGIAPDGCPDRDRDGDNIANVDDRCPDAAENINGFEDGDGCPDEIPDSDNDGLKDDVDRCKNQPEDMDQFQDGDGCPDEDNDSDGVTDDTDACPMKSGPPENRGCPDTDRDGDGVVDRLDNCPDEPGLAKRQGCKRRQLVIIQGSSLQILDRVYFRTGRARIRRRSFRLLNNVAAVLAAHSELIKIEVAGHTDDRGTNDDNKVLSQARAEAVVAYLVKRGIDPERLTAVGYGEEQPAEEGTSRRARRANRRVEFKVVQSTATQGGGEP